MRFFSLLMSIGLACVAIYLVNWGMERIKASNATMEWGITEGEILRSSVRKSSGTGRNSSPSFIVNVEYEYSVVGVKYVGTSVYHHALASFNRRDRAEAFEAEHPPGRKVTVRYDPSDPKQSVLNPGATAEGYFLILLGGFAGFMSLMGALSTRNTVHNVRP